MSLAARAQPPRIDSMLVDEKMSELRIWGDFGSPKGAVWVDSVQLQINTWSDSLLSATIPASGKGASGLVVVAGRSIRSEGRMLTAWSMGMTFAVSRSASYYLEYTHNEWVVNWRCDLDSRLRSAHPGIGQSVPVSLAVSENHTYHLESYDPQTKVNTVQDENLSGAGISTGRLDITTMTFFPNVPDEAQGSGYAYTPTIVLDTALLPVNGYIETGTDPFFPARFSWGNPIGTPNLVFNPPIPLIRQLRFQPILLKPDSGVTSLVTDGDTVQWNSMPLMAKYHLQVFNDSILSNKIVDTLVFDTTFALPSLSNNTKYYWHIAGINAEGESRWSNVWNFTTGSSANVTIEKDPNINIYPNPTNGKLIIDYDQSDGDLLNVTVFNIEGKVLNRFTIQGQYTLDMSRVSPGSYLLEIKGKNFNSIKNITVVK